MGRIGLTWRTFVNMVAYVSIVCIGLALLIGKVGAGSLAEAFEKIAQILAYIVTAIFALIFAFSRRHWVYFLIWGISVTLIVLLIIL